jgi:hypothetical protein
MEKPVQTAPQGTKGAPGGPDVQAQLVERPRALPK